jgi:hypothetical protein
VRLGPHTVEGASVTQTEDCNEKKFGPQSMRSMQSLRVTCNAREELAFNHFGKSDCRCSEQVERAERLCELDSLLSWFVFARQEEIATLFAVTSAYRLSLIRLFQAEMGCTRRRLSTMAMRRSKCFSCGSSNLRLSHFRLMLFDVFGLAVLRLPVRCRYCRERFHLNVLSAMKVFARDHSSRSRINDHGGVTTQALEL